MANIATIIGNLVQDSGISTTSLITSIDSTTITTALGYTPVTNARTITINGTSYDLSADRSWTINASGGVTSFNTRTGAVTLSSADVTGALGYTPYNSTNPSGYITSSASITGTSSGVTQSLSGGNDANLVYAAMADNDFFRIRVGGSSNAGWVEIATADDGTEPIYVRQYTGVFSSLTRTATLLDGSGNTSFPGTVTAPTFSGNLSGNASSASSVAWSNVSSKPSLIMYYQGFTLNADTMDANASGFTYSVNAPYTGPIARLGESGYSLQLNASYGGGGTSFAFRTRNGDGGYFNAWRRILNEGADPYAANMNQYVRTSDSPSFVAVSGNDVYTTGGWFRNHTNNNGIYWSNTGWHLYPENGNDFWFRSGNTSEATIHFMKGGSGSGNYIHNASDNAIGFLSTGRSWILRVDNGGGTTVYGGLTVNSSIRVNANTNLYLDYNHGCSIVGVYSSYRYQGVFSMGDSWKLAIDGTSPGNLYGLSWSHPNAGGQAGRLNDHGLLVMINGVTQAAISSNIWAAGDVTAYSDIRVKENIQVITNAIEKVKVIRGVTYTRNDMSDTTKRHAGVIAQEVLAVLPEVVTEDVNGHYSVAYGNITSLLIEAIKEQQKQIEELKSIIDGLTK